MGVCLFGQSSKQHMKAAEQFIENGYFEEAIQQYNIAIELDPQNGQAYEERGNTNENLGNLEEASNDFRSAAVFGTNSAENYFHSAMLLYKLDDYEKALANVVKALEQKQKFYDAYILQSEIFLSQNKFLPALKAAEKAIDSKNNSYANYLAGLAHFHLKNNTEAEQYFEKAIIKDKLLIDAYLALAELQLQIGKINYAIENCTYAIDHEKDNAKAYMVRSKCYQHQTKYNQAISDISKAISLDTSNTEYFIVRGEYYSEFAQYQNAINDFTLALNSDVTNWNAIYNRALAYEKIGIKSKAISDYSLLLNFSAELDPSFVNDINAKIYDLNRENDKPVINLTNPTLSSNFQLLIPGDKDQIDIVGNIEDDSKIRFLKINNDTLINDPDGKSKKDFSFRLDAIDLEFITVSTIDIYNNSTTVSYAIERIETHAPRILLRNPYAGDDGLIAVKSDDNSLYLDGQIEDESLISNIKIDGVIASYAPTDFNPRFTATIDITKKNRIEITAIDEFGNVSSNEYLLQRDGRMVSDDTPMGKTWVVLIENSIYKDFSNLKSPPQDIQLMQQALARYNINKTIVKRNLSKRELERFFSIDLRDLIRANNVNSLFIWFAGHGKNINGTGYWIPSDAITDVEFSYFSINALKASLYSYTSLDHLLVVSDACQTGENFCLALRSPANGAACSDTQLALKKSAQVFTSAGNGYAYDNSLFTQAFANTLLNSEDDCVTIDDIAKRVIIVLRNNSSQQTPEFGRIKGLDDELGSFFFITR